MKASTIEVTKETAIEMLQRIRTTAENALANGSSCVFLVIRRESPPRGEMVIMCQTEGPRGRVINAVHVKDYWRVTASFQAMTVAAWCSQKINEIISATN